MSCEGESGILTDCVRQHSEGDCLKTDTDTTMSNSRVIQDFAIAQPELSRGCRGCMSRSAQAMLLSVLQTAVSVRMFKNGSSCVGSQGPVELANVYDTRPGWGISQMTES
jgi:hypothetical protein